MINYFDNIYCINLDRRTDRWFQCVEEFDKLGISDKVERFSAIEMNPGIAGCTKSHYELIKLAKKRNENNILIFEDDFEAVNDSFWSILEKTIHQLQNHDLAYDMLYFGGRICDTEGAVMIDSNLIKLNYVKTTHAYAINSRMFDVILNSFDSIDWSDPWNWSQRNENRLNIDLWYINNIQTKFNVYGIYPAVFQQRTSYSDIINNIAGAKLWNIDNSWNQTTNIKNIIK